MMLKSLLCYWIALRLERFDYLLLFVLAHDNDVRAANKTATRQLQLLLLLLTTSSLYRIVYKLSVKELGLEELL